MPHSTFVALPGNAHAQASPTKPVPAATPTRAPFELPPNCILNPGSAKLHEKVVTYAEAAECSFSEAADAIGTSKSDGPVDPKILIVPPGVGLDGQNLELYLAATYHSKMFSVDLGRAVVDLSVPWDRMSTPARFTTATSFSVRHGVSFDAAVSHFQAGQK